ncbi:MAG: alpha-E domain-containing protein [Sandaracinaceae bacterium]|nr:alpha-E domain-containing protein [Sandaracinaceae bacterium]
MISRVAGSCFWLHRYLERAQSVAQLLRVNRSFVLDVPVDEIEKHYPLIIVCGEQARFDARVEPSLRHDRDVVEDYLTWDGESPVSLRSSLYWARENARTTREVISLEMWESLNDVWTFVRFGAGRRKYNTDRDAFFKRIKDGCDLVLGQTESTLLEGEPLDFMRLGRFLERANQTARMLDVKHHTLGPPRGAETPVETAQWNALLYSCGAAEAYHKRWPARPDGRSIADFLVKEPDLPRSVLGSLLRARDTLARIRAAGHPALGVAAERALDALVAHAREAPLGAALHEELTHVIDETTTICVALERDYFDPGDQRALLEPAP